MLFQILPDMDTRQYANSEQATGFAPSTTDFFGMQLLQMDRDVALRTLAPRGQYAVPRQEFVESLERSLREHGDIWAELANH
jgi:hypothetical protein